jgi:short-subunit dehydrogenase
MTSTAARCWLVLGASSAIARSFARAAAARGHDLLLAGRDAEDLERLAADVTVRHGVWAAGIPFDATDFGSHASFVAAVRETVQGRLDVFLCFARDIGQDALNDDPALALPVIAATYTGAVSVLQHLAPLIEEQKAGRVVIVGSVAGDRGRLKNYVYGSAKAGLHAYSQGLRARLWRAGASVTTVKPGFVDTALTWASPGMALVADPKQVGTACLAAAERGAEVVYLPGFWWVIMTIIRLLPERIAKRLSF